MAKKRSVSYGVDGRPVSKADLMGNSTWGSPSSATGQARRSLRGKNERTPQAGGLLGRRVDTSKSSGEQCVRDIIRS